nr:pentatricopeptide repeat-containing protein At1g62350-like [Populus alba]
MSLLTTTILSLVTAAGALTYKNDKSLLDQAFRSKFNRLLKFVLTAVPRQLLRQNHCLLALKVKEEYWYKPQVVFYDEMIKVMSSNRFIDEVRLLFFRYLETEISGDLHFKLRGLFMECYEVPNLKLEKKLQNTKSVVIGCEPNRSPFKLLVSGLEYIGESVTVRQDAYKYYGDSLNYDGGRDSKLSYLIRDRSKFQLLKWLVHHNLAVRVPCEEQPGMCVQLHVADREIIHGLLVLQCQHESK